MPIEISEIRVVATVQSGEGAKQPAAQGGGGSSDKAELIEEAVEAVLRILEERKER